MVSGLITILGTLVLIALALALWPLILAAGLILAAVSLFGIAALLLAFTPLWFSLPAAAVAVGCFVLFAAPIQRASGHAQARGSTHYRAAVIIAALMSFCLLVAAINPAAGVGLATLLMFGYLIATRFVLNAEADRLRLPSRKSLPLSRI